MQLQEGNVFSVDIVRHGNKLFSEIVFITNLEKFEISLPANFSDGNKPTLLDFMNFMEGSSFNAIDCMLANILVNNSEVLAIINSHNQILPMCIDWPTNKDELIKFFENRGLKLEL